MNVATNPEINRGIYLAEAHLAVQHALETVYPGSFEAERSPMELLPESGDRREDSKPLLDELTPQQESEIRRTLMVNLGVGLAENRGPQAVGLRKGYAAVIEPGQPHKEVAEANMVDKDEVQPGMYIFPGTPGRMIPEAEKNLAVTIYNGVSDPSEIADNEYDMRKQGLRARAGFEPLETPVILPYFYTYDRHTETAEFYQDPAAAEDGRAQFELFGHYFGKPVVTMRIDRENFTIPNPEDPEKPIKRYAQPVPAVTMKLIREMMQAELARGAESALPLDEETQIGFVTSHLYPSRKVAAAVAGAGDVRVAAYGVRLLSEIKNEPMQQPKLNQITAEIYEVTKTLQRPLPE